MHVGDYLKEELKELLSWREMDDGDTNFILSTFLRGLYHGNYYFKNIDSDIFYRNYEQVVKNILSRSTVEVIVCCLKEEPSVIIGFAILESKEILHWIYVKRAWRVQGVARSLVPIDLQYVTHLTESGKSILKKQERNIKYNPFYV